MDPLARSVRQRTDDRSHEVDAQSDNETDHHVGQELLSVMKGVGVNSQQFPEHGAVMHFINQPISDEILVATTQALIHEWSTRRTDTKRVVIRIHEEEDADCERTSVRHEPMSTFEWAMGCDHPHKRFDLWRMMHSEAAEECMSAVPRKLNLIVKKLKYILLCLYQELRKRNMLLGTREEEEEEHGVCETHFVRVSEIITSCYTICLEELRVHVNVPNPNATDEWAIYDATSSEQKMTRKHVMCQEEGELTPFQNLHAYLLNILQGRGYRKSGELLYVPVYSMYNERSYRTGAWKLAYDPPTPSTFATFYTDVVCRHVDYAAYLDSTSSFRMRPSMVEQLVQEEEPECPTVVFNRLFISFRNAIVHMLGAVFPLDRKDEWQEIADRKNAEWNEFASVCAKRLETIGVMVRPFDLASRVMPGTGDDMRIRPPSSEDATIHYIDEEIPEALFQLRFDGSNFGDTHASAVHPADPWNSPLFAYLDAIETPEFDSVQTTQQFSTSTRFWDLVSMGRGFFPGKTLDNAHYFPMHQGRAGTGKSLKLQVLQSYFPLERLGILSSRGGEKTFWSHGMQHKWIFFWLEVQSRGEPPIDRGTFQQLVGYELVNLPQKNGPSVMQENRAPIYVSGNEYFNYEDSSGSLRRRTMTFLYDYKPKERQPDLESKIREKRGPLLLKMLHSYHLSLMLFPYMDWEQHLPMDIASTDRRPIIGEQLLIFHRRAVEQLDPLQSFMNVEGEFEFAPELMMSEAEFIHKYNEYRKNMLNKEKAIWNQGHYQIAFEHMDIRRASGEMREASTGAIRSMACLYGIAPKETDEPVF